jgi:hypothetical protein
MGGGKTTGRERIVTNAELAAMGTCILDLLLSSIEAADRDTAKMLCRRMYNEFMSMHDLYRDWVTHLLTIIGEQYGDEGPP